MAPEMRTPGAKGKRAGQACGASWITRHLRREPRHGPQLDAVSRGRFPRAVDHIPVGVSVRQRSEGGLQRIGRAELRLQRFARHSLDDEFAARRLLERRDDLP